MTSITEKTETAQPAQNAGAKPTRKANVGARRANLALQGGDNYNMLKFRSVSTTS